MPEYPLQAILFNSRRSMQQQPENDRSAHSEIHESEDIQVQIHFFSGTLESRACNISFLFRMLYKASENPFLKIQTYETCRSQRELLLNTETSSLFSEILIFLRASPGLLSNWGEYKSNGVYIYDTRD
jgi:hypothetical protein